MGSNMQRLGETLSGRMKRTSAAAVPTTLELGTINPNLSLTTDSLPTPIPKGDYMVNIMLASESYQTGSDTHSHDGGEKYTHSHDLPSGLRPPKSGDRVLVAWCGNEPVVMAIVTSS